MRGASALDDVLRSFPDAPIRVVVVWEPVLPTDVAPPFSSVLSRIRDRRAIQFWDPQRALSGDLVRAVRVDPGRYGFEQGLPQDYIVWDVVAIFGSEARWSQDLPVPAFYDGPVYAVAGALRNALERELENRAPVAE